MRPEVTLNMRNKSIAVGALIAATCGCHNTPPPSRVAVPAQEDRAPMTRYETDARKPLAPPPPRASQVEAPPFDDAPLVNQQAPETPAFLDAYRRVGSPRMVVFVNRTMEGEIVPVNANDPVVSVEDTRRNGANPEKRRTVDVYLHPGQYDEADAKSLDYEAVENILMDMISADNQVTLVSPTMVRQRLSDQEVKELQQGRPRVLREIAEKLDANVLIQVQAHPTRQTQQGVEFRIVAEALNTKTGESIGRAVVDAAPPLEKTTINRYTRFLGRKLMMGMTASWLAPAPPQNAAPATQP
jgi:hypothetical protein